MKRLNRVWRLSNYTRFMRSKQKPQSADRQGSASLRELARMFGPFVAPHWPAITLTALLVVAGTAMGLLRPWPLKFLFDEVLIPGTNQGSTSVLVVGIAAAVMAIAVADSLLGFLRHYILKAVGQKVAFSLRLALYGQLQRLSLTFHDRQQTGDLITRVTKDVDKVQDLITNNIVEASSNALTLAGMLIVMFWLDWQLELVMMAFLPLLFFFVSRYRRRIKQVEQHVRRKEGDITSLAQETISAIRLVKAFGRESFERDRFEAHTGEALTANLRASRTEAAFGSFMDVLLAVALASLIWIGAQRVLSGNLTPGDLLIFISYVREFYSPTRTLSKLAGQISRTSVSAEKIAEVLREEPAVKDLPDAQPAPRLRGHVKFEHVGFAYIPGHSVLSDIDFEVEPGQVVALVGKTGAGKSTIAGLIPRLYDPTEGRILIDGVDVRRYQLATLQPQISFVLQNSVLFRATVRENIAYGQPNASFEAIQAAAIVANAHEFIVELPNGYDTVIGERGDTLSGGQRQRIAIARAIIRDAPILILDEPTTGLDAKSEYLLMEALDRLMEGRTTIIIAHKLATIRRADMVLVIDHGQIVERGSRQDLLDLGGRYAELHQLQSTIEVGGLASHSTSGAANGATSHARDGSGTAVALQVQEPLSSTIGYTPGVQIEAVPVAPPVSVLPSRRHLLILGVCMALILGALLWMSSFVIAQPEVTSATPPAVPATVLPSANTSALAASAAATSAVKPTSELAAGSALVVASPTALPPATPARTAAPATASDLLKQVAAAEAALRTGQFDAEIVYDDGSRSSARVRFDLGDAQQAPRLHITTTYVGATGAPMTVERITVGARSWQRQAGEDWRALAAQEGVWGELQTYLPHADAIPTAEIARGQSQAELRWHDSAGDADVTLIVDPTDGTPRELRRSGRSTGLSLVVTYSAWNTSVAITPPAN